MDSSPKSVPATAHQPYTHCKTHILDMRPLGVPNTASDEEYRALYTAWVRRGTPESAKLQAAIESIQYGLAPPVAFPSETVYGLGHTATSTAGVSAIFATKGRPSDNPLIVHASSIPHLERMINGPLPAQYHVLVQKYWPGPLTILLPVPRDSIFSDKVHPGQNTIAFRIPSSKYARFFIAATNLPIAGPSANSSGKPSPTTAQHVYDDLNGKINFILDGGPCDVGVESTVVDGLYDPPLILRPGGVSLAELRALGGHWSKTAIGYKRHRSAASTPNGNEAGTGTTTPDLDGGDEEHIVDISGAPRAPGMKYKHYAPQGRLILFTRQAVANGRVADKLAQLRSLHQHEHQYQHQHDQVHPNDSSHIHIGIITRRWARFAGLVSTPPPPTSSSIQDNGSSNGNDNGHVSTSQPPRTTPTHAASGTETATATATATIPIPDSRNGHSHGHSIVLHEANLGPNIARLAHQLFSILRRFDHLGCRYIFAECVDEDEDGTGAGAGGCGCDPVVDAVADRIDKASSERVEY